MANIHNMTNDEILKLKAAVLYVISKCGDLDYFHLFKILYFADKEHYAYYGRRILNDTFCAMPKGPVPSFLFDAIKIAIGKTSATKDSPLKIISDVLTNSDSSYDYILSALESPDMDELSISDIYFLDKSIEENRDLTFDVLSEKSHDLAWEKAWEEKHNSEIDPILMAKAGGANEGMIYYIKINKTVDSLAY